MKAKLTDTPVPLRQLPGAGILDAVNCAYIAERYFGRSRSWFMQRLNNNLVNGRPASFTPTQLLELRLAFKSIASELIKFSTQIPNLPTDMSVKVYVITDPELIDFIQNDDLDGFKTYLDESKENDNYILFDDPETFDTEAEALAYCVGLAHGSDERATPDRYPLRSSEPADLPFIAHLESY